LPSKSLVGAGEAVTTKQFSPKAVAGAGSTIMTNEEIIAFLKVHLQCIQDNDTETYNETTAEVASHNESRVIRKLNDTWKVVHVHQSPAWQSPHIQS
jgi:hypothetical protein